MGYSWLVCDNDVSNFSNNPMTKPLTRKKKVYMYEVWLESVITEKVFARNSFMAKKKAEKINSQYSAVQAVRLTSTKNRRKK